MKTLKDEFDATDDEFPLQYNTTSQESETTTTTSDMSSSENAQVLNITPTSMTTSDSCSDEPDFPKIGIGNYFPTWIFNDMIPEEVTQLPPTITGQKLYKVVGATNDHWKDKVQDQHFFLMKSSSRVGFSGIHRIGTCLGSYVCPNESCNFKSTSKNNQPNKVNEINCEQKGQKIGKICEHYGVRECCGAQKLVEFNRFQQNVIVYHLGEHTCWQKVRGPQKNHQKRSGHAKNMALQRCMDKIEQGDIDGAEQEAKDWELNIYIGINDMKHVSHG